MPPIITKPTTPFLVKNILGRGVRYFPKKEIVSRTRNRLSRYTYADFYKRICQLANVLKDFGVERGDRVATFARNTHWHMELYFALPCMGSIVHPLNVMLPAEQLIYIINHAEDKLLFVDEEFIPIIEKLKDDLKCVKAYIIMTDLEKLPATTLAPVYSYEELMSKASPDYIFPEDLDELEATFMAYSSGTTGMPRPTFYSHRNHYISCMTFAGIDHFELGEDDVVLHFVPMFHAASWNIPYAATLIGTKQVYPGPYMDPKSLCDLIEQERITWAGAVPTVWLGIFNVAEREKRDISSLRIALVAGAPGPPALLEKLEECGITAIHGYGTTETTGASITVSKHKSYMKGWPKEKRYAQRARQGLPDAVLQVKVLNEKGEEVQWNDKEMGEIWFKAPGLAWGHYKDPERTAQLFTANGWMNTGDIGTVDEYGFVKIVDRSKDVIKSGGEWISSVDLENLIMAHPKVLEACVVAMPHPKWDERPLAWVVPKQEYKEQITKEEIIQFLEQKVNEGKIAKWWLPDEVVFAEAIPKTATGKFNKKAIRATILSEVEK